MIVPSSRRLGYHPIAKPRAPATRRRARPGSLVSKASPGRNGAAQAMAYPPGHALRVTRARGIYVYDDDKGYRAIDLAAGTFNVGLGYGHPAVVAAMVRVLESGATHVSSSFANDDVEQAAANLVRVAPPSLTRCHMKGSTGGSEANEQALRTAHVVSGKRTVAAFRHGHHGQTVLTSHVSGMPYRRSRLPAAAGLPVLHVPPPDCYRCPYDKTPETCALQCLRPVEEALDNPPGGEDDIACFIAEPIIGAGGGLTPPKRYWPELHERLKARGILLIFDEVQTFGRTGGFFAAGYYGVEPDMITLAKGISGIGVAAAAAVLLRPEHAVLKSTERSLTGGASPLVCAAVAATIDVMDAPGFFEGVQKSAEVLADGLHQIRHRFDCVGEVRGVGLMTGLEIVRSKESKQPHPDLTNRIIDKAERNGLLLRNSQYDRGSFLKVRPPLVITPDEARESCDRLERSIADAVS